MIPTQDPDVPLRDLHKKREERWGYSYIVAKLKAFPLFEPQKPKTGKAVCF
jgi:hypothetical protein